MNKGYWDLNNASIRDMLSEVKSKTEKVDLSKTRVNIQIRREINSKSNAIMP